MNPEKLQENIKYPAIAVELKSMEYADQAMRQRVRKSRNFDEYKLDENNTARMKEIIAEIGFPTKSKVGEDGVHSAWLLVQHADKDVAFQQRCLELINQEPEGEIEKIDIAYLEDRVRVNQKRGQLYGTQFNQKDNKHVPEPIEDEENVDIRRARMGMDTLADQIRRMYENYPLD